MEDSSSKTAECGEKTGLSVKYWSDNQTFIFWNLNDCPIPHGGDFVSITNNIESALERMGIIVNTSHPIYAYGDYKMSESESRRTNAVFEGASLVDFKLPWDMITFHSASGNYPTNFVVIAKHNPKSHLERVLHCLNNRNHAMILVQPPCSTTLNDVKSIIACTSVLGKGKLADIRPAPPTSYNDFKPLEQDRFMWTLHDIVYD